MWAAGCRGCSPAAHITTIGQLTINYHGIFVPVCVCGVHMLCMCAQVCAGMNAHVCMCVWRPEVDREFLINALLHFFDTGFLLAEPGSHRFSNSKWPVSSRYLPICLHLPSARNRGIHCYGWLFCVHVECGFRSLMLAWQTLYHLSHVPIPLWRIFNDLYYKNYKSNMKYFNIYYRVIQKV